MYENMWRVVLFSIFLLSIATTQCVFGDEAIPKLRGVRFLVTVNDTWADPPGCIKTVATNVISPNKTRSRSEHIAVGACDNGPLTYTVLSPGMNNNKYTVSLTFYSSVVEDASPPTCNLSWNGTYLLPKKQSDHVDLLPSCFTGDSREGYHMTYYWFHILDWEFDDEVDSDTNIY